MLRSLGCVFGARAAWVAMGCAKQARGSAVLRHHSALLLLASGRIRQLSSLGGPADGSSTATGAANALSESAPRAGYTNGSWSNKRAEPALPVVEVTDEGEVRQTTITNRQMRKELGLTRRFAALIDGSMTNRHPVIDVAGHEGSVIVVSLDETARFIVQVRECGCLCVCVAMLCDVWMSCSVMRAIRSTCTHASRMNVTPDEPSVPGGSCHGCW